MKRLDGEMRVVLDVDACLMGGSVVVQIGDETAGKKLATMVVDLIESREGPGGSMATGDVQALQDVEHELRLAADLLANRVELERSRARAMAG